MAMRCLRSVVLALLSIAALHVAHAAAPCGKPLYLTFDTGHMGVAPLIAEVLNRQNVKVTFFAANEPTKEGDGSLGDHWAPWWKARGAEGHAFASHTFDHVYWRADQPHGTWQMRPSAGPNKGKTEVWNSARYCAELQRANTRLQQLTIDRESWKQRQVQAEEGSARVGVVDRGTLAREVGEAEETLCAFGAGCGLGDEGGAEGAGARRRGGGPAACDCCRRADPSSRSAPPRRPG